MTPREIIEKELPASLYAHIRPYSAAKKARFEYADKIEAALDAAGFAIMPKPKKRSLRNVDWKLVRAELDAMLRASQGD